MMKFKMKSLALAVGTVLGGISLIPSVQAVQLATDGLGEALIVPYYTTRAGWNTLINITNTSAEAVAVKVRFHEGYNSRDVFDFNVVLSPYDVWNGWVENGTGNVPRFKTNDNSCTIPQIVPGGAGQLFQGGGANGILAYTSPTGGIQAADGGPTDTERMREGYIVLMEMGSASSGSAYNASLHNPAGIPADCAGLRTLFSTVGTGGDTGTGITALRAAFPNYVANPLKGSFSLVNSSLGQNAAGTMTTLADFFKLNPNDANDSHSLVTLQLSPTGVGGTGSLLTSFLEPDLHSTNTPGFVLWDGGGTTSNTFATPGTAEVATTAQLGPDQVLGGIDAVSFVLGRTNVVNQWARNTEATNGWATASDWVVTFPTKRFYTDQATHQFAARAAGRPFTTPPATAAPPVAGVGGPQTARWSGITASGTAAPGITSLANPFAQLFTQTGPPTASGALTGQSCDPVTYDIWNREEEQIIVGEGGPVFSPAPSTPGNAICGEVNVLDFDGSRILGSADALYANISDLPGPNGWMDLNLQNTASNANFGLPVIGFSIITRATSSGSLNEAFIVDHAYKRNLPVGTVNNITVTVPTP
ncbi:MAG: hypothetical protein LM550_04545 [Candidatus Contendobacter sp.]|jgi:hypothetical protein|nr:hypothetical protein [Candidatus Contendobacter sp.]